MSDRKLGARQQDLLERLESPEGLQCPDFYGNVAFASLLERLADPDDAVVSPGRKVLLRFEVDPTTGRFHMFTDWKVPQR